MKQDQPYAAGAMIAGYAAIVAFTDNYVRVIAEEGGLWQFHAMRGAIALGLIGLVAWVTGQSLRVRRPWGVAGRSAIHGLAMLIYFGALAFLPVAQVAAGLFMAPIFVLVLGRLLHGRRMGLWSVLAVGLGFAGVLLVLGPNAVGGASVAGVLPVVAGLFYALGNMATRDWCEGEGALVLLGGFFGALCLFGCVGMGVLWLWPVDVAAGADGFIARGAVWPSGTFLFWTVAQAVGSMVGVGLMIRGYQVTTAARASVYEYALLPASAFWGWVLWAEGVTPVAGLGMGLITLAGVLIALAPQERSPVASLQ
ncbi:DMT family transporter [Neogemmobacter tilapiae]|uniref:Membrane protein n=1 Tax=Neogemmobacter tilapiae TaxID=875041 RepID=A0A918TIG8_9RHOB|nr:DMT family transporter [Gemmobacter tilapiae]GHC48581.1 membrane protein [Gemmobacter tilapiae]